MNQEDNIEGLLCRYRAAALQRIERAGSMATGRGDFGVGKDSISFASDHGCETFNDDFVAVWRPFKPDAIHWTAAIADGVTGSLLAQEAAELACYLGLSAIAKASRNSAVLKNPIGFVTRVFQRIGSQVIASPDDFAPDNCPKSIWQVSVREGKFLQTTLNLLWATEEGIRIMAVGDGGLLYSYANAPKQFTTHTFGAGKLRCLGPRSSPVQPEAYLLENWRSVACYTDGLAAAVQELSDLPAMLCERKQTVSSVIEGLNNEHPELVDDNLSAFRVKRSGE